MVTVDTLLDPAGTLARSEAWFDPRPEQRAMACAIEKALSQKHHLLVEAGTGVGKSLAYLLPTALWAVRNKKKVMVATHTKALQEQLIHHDLPRAQAILKALGHDLQFAMLMGADNYLCLQRLHQARSLQKDLFEASDSMAHVEDLLKWSSSAATGLRSKIPFRVSPDVWRMVCRDSDLCLGKRGPFWEACLYRKDIAQARQADILVVNHSLFFAGAPTPTADAVILDEAHQLENSACQFLGSTTSNRGIERLLNDLLNPASGKGLIARLRRSGAWRKSAEEANLAARHAGDLFFQAIRETLNLAIVQSDARRTTGEASAGRVADGSQTPGAKRVTKPLTISETLSTALEALAALLNETLAESRDSQEELDIKALIRRCLGAAAGIREFMEVKKPDVVYWVETWKSRLQPITELRTAPLDISVMVRESVFQKYGSAILTSATLTVDRSFQALRDALGCDQAEGLQLDSPFDYARQAGLYLAREIPDPKADTEAYEEAVIRQSERIIPLVSGGIFILFTSWQHLHRFRARLHLQDRTIFKQGEAPPAHLVKEFKKSGRGVLLGTDTFWEGVDVPGKALSAVLIMRLPFLSPESPYEEAKQEWLQANGVNVFESYLLPKAVVRFRQGFGRLIRSKTDRGIVAVLDPRIQSKPYGRVFLRSLPACRRLDNLSEIAAFFARST